MLKSHSRFHLSGTALVLGATLCLVYPFKLSAYNSDCNPVLIKELNEKYTATMLCSSMEPKHFKTCLTTLGAVGAASFLTGVGFDLEARSKLGNTAAQADMSRLRKYFPKAMEELIARFKERKGTLKDARSLLEQLRHHPHLYGNQISNFSSGIRLKVLSNYFKKFGVLAVALAYLEGTAFTPPEDCKKLSFSGILPEDQKWVDFGMNCSRHIDTSFFTQSFDDQLLITQRSPDLCKAITSFRDDLDRMIQKVLAPVFPLTDGPPTDTSH